MASTYVSEIPAGARAGHVWWVALVCSLLLLLYAEPARDLALEWWTNDAASHGMLIPPMAFGIAWLQRNRTLSVPANPDARALLALTAACLLYLLGKLGAEFFVTRLSFVLMLASIVWLFEGLRRLHTLAFPFVLLATMIPMPSIIFNALASPLQLLASDVATRVEQELGVAIYRQGNVIHLATIELVIAEAAAACIRYRH
jgi:exosortase